MCECIERINPLLKPYNTQLELVLFFDGTPIRPVIGVEKVDSKVRGKPTGIIAKYCPFCGEKYPEKVNEPSANYMETK
jgi:hypothetical protein